MKLEEEARLFMQGKSNTFDKKLEELVENTRLLKNLSEVILKKAKELNVKDNLVDFKNETGYIEKLSPRQIKELIMEITPKLNRGGLMTR